MQQSNEFAKTSPRGPGLFESCFWFLGTGALHILGVALTTGLLVGIFLSAGVTLSQLQVLEFLETQQFTLLAGEQFVFVSLVLLLAWWRLKGNLGHRLSSRPLPLLHVFLLTCLVIPLSTVTGFLHAWGMEVWQSLLAWMPQLGVLDTKQSMELMQDLSLTSPTWALLLVLAIAPALGEEILFRGVIGRGLINRCGVVGGILLTSFLFALAHLHPIHALAVFPIGIVLHYVYYTTRSFWAPLYLHFCNNAWAVVMASQSRPTADPAAETLGLSATILVGLSLAWFLTYLWQTRIRYLQEDGTEWNPDRPSLELPVEISLQKTFSSLPLSLSLGGLVPLVGFLIVRASLI